MACRDEKAMTEYAETESLQQRHFDGIAAEYAAHYGDPWSQRYRHRFINDRLFASINLAGAKVIDAMCGSGETTGYLLERGAQVTGVDISPNEMAAFQRRFPTAAAKCASILATGLESEAYDCVVVVGGLHHLHPHVPEAVHEIHRILKVGGDFCFMEPHQGTLPDRLRRLWYKHDRLFAENEAAIDLEAMKGQFAANFQFLKEEYKGNLAYLFVLNSLVFRLPLWLKPLYAAPLIMLESLIQRIQGRRLSCFVVGHWRKL